MSSSTKAELPTPLAFLMEMLFNGKNVSCGCSYDNLCPYAKEYVNIYYLFFENISAFHERPAPKCGYTYDWENLFMKTIDIIKTTSMHVFYKKVVEYNSFQEEEILLIDKHVCMNMTKYLKRIRHSAYHEDVAELSICCYLIDNIRLKVEQLEIENFEEQCIRVYKLFSCTKDYQTTVDLTSNTHEYESDEYKSVKNTITSIMSLWDDEVDEDINILMDKIRELFNSYVTRCKSPVEKYATYVYENTFPKGAHNRHINELTKYAIRMSNTDTIYDIIIKCIRELELSWPSYIYSKLTRINLNEIELAKAQYEKISPHLSSVMYTITTSKRANILMIKNTILSYYNKK